MPAIDVNVEGDNAWPDLQGASVIHLPDVMWRLAVLRGGMSSGRTSISLRLDLPEGKVVIAETSLAALQAAWAVIAAACREELDG